MQENASKPKELEATTSKSVPSKVASSKPKSLKKTKQKSAPM